MTERGGGGVSSGAVAKIPKPIGDGAGGDVSEKDGQGLETVGGCSGKKGRGHHGPNARENVSTVAERGEEQDDVAKTAGAGGSKLNRDRGGAEPRQIEQWRRQVVKGAIVEGDDSVEERGSSEVADQEVGFGA